MRAGEYTQVRFEVRGEDLTNLRDEERLKRMCKSIHLIFHKTGSGNLIFLKLSVDGVKEKWKVEFNKVQGFAYTNMQMAKGVKVIRN